jgi:hypothetical protein
VTEVRTVVDLPLALTERLHPAITRWNRLEGRPRTHDFERALRAEVRDALWMLSRQWQMGEFEGDDAGSPMLAKAAIDIAKLDRYRPGQSAPEEVLRADVPLGAWVERRPLPIRQRTQYLSLDLRLVVGRRWLKMLEASAASATGLSMDYRASYRTEYGIELPDPSNRAHAPVAAHPEAWRYASAAAGGRAMDGIALLEHAAQPGAAFFDNIGAAGADEPILASLGDALQGWLRDLILQPPADGNDAWQPSRFEYQFGLSGPTDSSTLVLEADEYARGNLDWYAVDKGPDGSRPDDPPTARTRVVRTFVPASVVFEGMPNTRWWAFEDRRTNFGDVRPDTTDLPKLLLMEFALVYANDWFVLPFDLDVGHAAVVQGIAVTNVFGERTWVTTAPVEPGGALGRWSAYALSPAGPMPDERPLASLDPELLLLPTAPQIHEGAAIEEVALIRDEIANMVWGVERRVPIPSGDPRPGPETARQTLAYMERIAREAVEAAGGSVPGAPPEFAAPIRYQVQNTIPEYWIPFIPVHVDADNREIQLQRSALPRILVDQTHDPVRPRSSLIGSPPAPYFVFEEEVPQAGVQVSQSYRRTRWYDGVVVTWLGTRKRTGRGEGSSGLRFDAIIARDA